MTFSYLNFDTGHDAVPNWDDDNDVVHYLPVGRDRVRYMELRSTGVAPLDSFITALSESVTAANVARETAQEALDAGQCYNYNERTFRVVNWDDDDDVIQFIAIGSGRARYRLLRQQGIDGRAAVEQVLLFPSRRYEPVMLEGWATFMETVPLRWFDPLPTLGDGDLVNPYRLTLSPNILIHESPTEDSPAKIALPGTLPASAKCARVPEEKD